MGQFPTVPYPRWIEKVGSRGGVQPASMGGFYDLIDFCGLDTGSRYCSRDTGGIFVCFLHLC